jgi:hypothetical protein
MKIKYMLNPVSLGKSYFKSAKGLYRNDFKDLKTLKNTLTSKKESKTDLVDEFVQNNIDPFLLTTLSNRFQKLAKYSLALVGATIVGGLLTSGALQQIAAFYSLVFAVLFYYMRYKAYCIYQLKTLSAKEYLKSEDGHIFNDYELDEKQLKALFEKRGYEGYVQHWLKHNNNNRGD